MPGLPEPTMLTPVWLLPKFPPFDGNSVSLLLATLPLATLCLSEPASADGKGGSFESLALLPLSYPQMQLASVQRLLPWRVAPWLPVLSCLSSLVGVRLAWKVLTGAGLETLSLGLVPIGTS